MKGELVVSEFLFCAGRQRGKMYLRIREGISAGLSPEFAHAGLGNSLALFVSGIIVYSLRADEQLRLLRALSKPPYIVERS